MPWKERCTSDSWANRFVGALSCPIFPGRSARHADPTCRWYVRVLDSTGFGHMHFLRHFFDALAGKRRDCPIGGQFCWRTVLPDPSRPFCRGPRPNPLEVFPGSGLGRLLHRLSKRSFAACPDEPCPARWSLEHTFLTCMLYIRLWHSRTICPCSKVNSAFHAQDIDLDVFLNMCSLFTRQPGQKHQNAHLACPIPFLGHALHEKGLQRQIAVGALLDSKQQRALAVLRLNRWSTTGQLLVNCLFCSSTFWASWKPTAPLALQRTVKGFFERNFASTEKFSFI